MKGKELRIMGDAFPVLQKASLRGPPSPFVMLIRGGFLRASHISLMFRSKRKPFRFQISKFFSLPDFSEWVIVRPEQGPVVRGVVAGSAIHNNY